VVGIIRVAWDIQLKIGGLPRIWGQIGLTIMAGHIQLPTFNKQEKGHFSTNWAASRPHKPVQPTVIANMQ